MRILAIRGRNLASLAREFEVDLASGELGGAGIFAICGPVGAGKSTLLDALCLALFDRTPRLSGRGGVAVAEEGRPEGHWLHSHDPRTLLRRGAGDGLAEVDFTGRDGRSYRASWMVRRARRRGDGRIQGQEMSLEDLDRGVTVARANRSEVLAAIRTRLGLDFAQFCRSVLLAQGEFAAFLSASADERASLLESLTGADIYRRLSRAAHDRRKVEKAKVEALESQSRSFELLDDEQRARLESEAAAMVQQVELSQIALDLASSVVAWYATAAGYREEEDKATTDLRIATDAIRASEPRRARGRALASALPLLPRAELVATRQQAVVDSISTRKSIEADLDALRERLDQQQRAQRAALSRVLPVGEGAPPPLITDFLRWRPALLRWSRFDAELRAIAIGVEEAKRAAESAERAHDAATAALEQARKDLHAEEYRDLAAARRQLVADRKSLRVVTERLRAREQSEAEVARRSEAVRACEAEQEQLADGFEELVAVQAAADGELNDVRRRLEHQRARSDLAAFRAHLIDDAPCPLCGSAEHPDPAVGDDTALRRAATEVERAEKAREHARDAVRERETRRRDCERALRATQAALEQAERDAVAASAEWQQLAEDLDGSTLAHRESELAEREAVFAELADRHDAAQQSHQQCQEAAQQAAAATQEARERLEQCIVASRQQAEAAAELAPGFAGIDSWQDCLRDAGDSLVDRLTILAEGEQSCRDSATVIAERERLMASQAATVEREERELQHANDALSRATAEASVSASDVREAAELGSKAIAREQDQLRELVEAEGRARAVLQKCVEIRKKHEDSNRPAIAEDDAALALEDTRTARQQASKKLEQVRAQLTADDFLRRQRAEVEPRLREAEAAFEVWATLDDLIGHSRGDAFAVFAQGLTLDLLLIEANRRLAELAGRFRLEKNRGRDMDFIVVDLDLGGARRGLQSLSGGETFLVSLALALALATLAAPRSRVETLFLDEGFGTLDAHNLEAALGALDSLQASGCQIGIISHVEGIAERIGTVVDVLPEGGGQSRIRVRTR